MSITVRKFPQHDISLLLCPHKVLTFGCQPCINRTHLEQMTKAYESPEFVIPTCPECKHAMILSDPTIPKEGATIP